MSVKDTDAASGQPLVRHYRIRNMDDGGFYVTPKKAFTSLPDMVAYYSGEQISPLYLQV